MEIWIPLAVAMIASPFLLYLAQRFWGPASTPTSHAEIADIYVESATQLLEPMRERIADLEQAVERCSDRVDRLEKERVQMLKHMFEHGLGWPP